MSDTNEGTDPLESVGDERTRQSPAEPQVQVRIDEQKMEAAYANWFRTSGTPEEVVLDLGLSLMFPAAEQKAPAQAVLQVNQRIIMSYYTAKRLAIVLGQTVSRHEEQFGTIELNAARRLRKRRPDAGGGTY